MSILSKFRTGALLELHVGLVFFSSLVEQLPASGKESMSYLAFQNVQARSDFPKIPFKTSPKLGCAERDQKSVICSVASC